MPIPIPAALAMLMLGSAAKYQSYQFSQKRQKENTEAEIARRTKAATTARTAQEATRGKYQKTVLEASEQAEQSRMAQVLNRNVAPIAQNIEPRLGVPRVLQETEAADRAEAASRVRSQGEQMAAMLAFGNALNALQPDLAKSAVTTGVSADAMQGGAGVLPLELAQAKARAYSPIGDILSNLGSYGMSSAIQNQKFS